MYWTDKRDGRPGSCLIEYFYSNIDGRSEMESQISMTIHRGSSKTILNYRQQVGRAGRNGIPSLAYVFIPPGSIASRMVDEHTRKIVDNSHDECIRKTFSLHLKLTVMTTEDILRCRGRSSCCYQNTVIFFSFNWRDYEITILFKKTPHSSLHIFMFVMVFTQHRELSSGACSGTPTDIT